MFVDREGKVLKDEGITHNVVGGVGIQSYLLNMLTKKTGRRVTNILGDESIRVQDYIRGTDDVDVALKLEGDDMAKMRRIKGIISRLGYEDISPCGEHIIEVKPERVGASRPTFRVYVNGEGSEEDVIAMNISRGQNGDLHRLDQLWYDKFLDGSREIVIPYCSGFDLKVNVPQLEHLLAPKIAHSRPKDLMDTQNIAELARETGVGLDFKEMERILLPKHDDNYRLFLSLGYSAELENFDRRH
jgi:hypothetical protein